MGNLFCCFFNNDGNKLKKEIKYKLWLNIDNADFSHPENLEDNIEKKEDIGLALPGGGLRACSTSLGYLRGLHKLDILKKIKYISSISGSSWVVGPMSYMDEKIFNLDDFFGEYIEPKDLTINKLSEIDNKNFSSLLPNNNFYMDGVENFIFDKFNSDKYNGKNFWSDTIRSAFFTKYKLDNYNSVIKMKSKNKYQCLESYDLRDDVPYPIINGTAILDTKTDCMPIEFTPLYYGLPGKLKIDDNTIIGNSYVEPIGFTSVKTSDDAKIMEQKLSKIKTKNIINVTTSIPDNKISLLECVAVSSSSIAASTTYSLSNSMYKFLDFTLSNYYNPPNFFTDKLRLCDGALYNNSGIPSLVRRNVKKIIFCCTNNMEITNYSNAVTSVLGCNLAGLFGVATSDNNLYNGISIDQFNKHSQIFESNKWDELCNKIKTQYEINRNSNTKISDKSSMIVTIDLNVLPNELAGVKGNYQTSLMVIIFTKDIWIDKLPKETQDLINNVNDVSLESISDKIASASIGEENFENYEFINTNTTNYSKKLVNALTQNASHIIIDNEIKIKEFLL
jgi:hypothetical protein